MSSDRAWFFKNLDGYTRTQFQCFVAEMTLSDDECEYVFCFRPTDAVRGSPDQYACRYLEIEVEEVKAARREKRLTDSIAEKSERELKFLGRVAGP